MRGLGVGSGQVLGVQTPPSVRAEPLGQVRGRVETQVGAVAIRLVYTGVINALFPKQSVAINVFTRARGSARVATRASRLARAGRGITLLAKSDVTKLRRPTALRVEYSGRPAHGKVGTVLAVGQGATATQAVVQGSVRSGFGGTSHGALAIGARVLNWGI